MALVTADLAALARSVICVGVHGTDSATLPLAELRAFGPGGIILFARNLAAGTDPAVMIAALRATVAPPAPLIAVDQEGGRVVRFTDPDRVAPLPAALAIGAVDDPAQCTAAARRLGRDLAQLGASVNFAPCADLALDAGNAVIGNRSFGEAPDRVAALVTAFAAGLEAGGVAAAIKHFPGHGATARDSHTELPRISAGAATLRGRDLVPFARAIAAGAVSLVMTAHVVVEAFDPLRPATLSPAILTGLLREELGFTGVIVTDCLEMGAIAGTTGTAPGALAALAAGADLLLISQDLAVAAAAAEGIAAAVAGGSLSYERLATAAARVGALRQRFAIAAAPDGGAEPGEPPGLGLAREAVTVLRGDLRLRDGLPVSVISFEVESPGEGEGADGAAGRRGTAPSLSAALRRRRWKSELMRVALDPDPADLDLLLTQLPLLGDRNFVVLMRRAHRHPAQRAAIDRVIAAVPTAILISAREPYDAALFPAARHLGCMYGDEAISLEGCADVLSGRCAPGGRLPVTIDRDVALR